jgi:O-antigen/teichoic acid export membrane protein
VTVAKVISEVVALAAMVALARLIPPAEFGRASVALIVTLLAAVIAGEGFGTPLVQRRSLERAHVQAAALMSLTCGAVLAAVTFAAAPLLSPLFGARIVDLIQLASPAFLIAGLGTVSHALLQRRLAFRRLGIIEAASIAFAMAASVVLALAGLDAEAVVLGMVLKSVCSSLLLLLSARPAPPRWHRRAVREIAAFGVPAALATLVNTGLRNVDYAILAARLSAAEVGLYWRAFQFGVEYQRKISGIMLRIALPVYSRSRDAAQMRAMRRRIVRVQAVLIFPLLGTFAVVAPVFVPWLLGPAWEGAVVPSQILAVAGMIASVITGLGPVVLAAGRPRWLLTYNIGSLAVYAATVLVTSSYGVNAVCAGVVCVYALQLVAAHLLLLPRTVGVTLRDLCGDVIPAGAATLALAAAAVPVHEALSRSGAPALAQLAGVAIVAGVAYLAALRVGFPAAWSDLALLVRRLLPARRARRSPAPLQGSSAAG